MNKNGIFYKFARKCYRIFIKPEYVYLVKKYNDKFIKQSFPELTKLKNRHNGQRCFIVGNGPSLNVDDLEKIKNEISFGTHRIYDIFDTTTWKPTYYCAQDYVLIKKSAKDIDKKIDFIKYIGMTVSAIYPKMNNAIYLNMISEDFYPDLPNFSEDISKCFYEGYTVTYMCLQIAVYMGFNEIYLLGVDHNYSVNLKADGTIEHNNVQDHFSSDDIIENLPQLDKSTLAYQAAKEFGDQHGIKIYNATRGGKLEIFERVDFDSLFPNDGDKT